MSSKEKGIYHWKLGDVALARLCKKVYARVQVIKDEKGLFYDDKVLAITANADNTITATKELCYYVETCRSQEKLWLPYTCMHLAERSRPFYGTDKISPTKADESMDKDTDSPKKRKSKEELIVPLNIKVPKLQLQDSNTAFDNHHSTLQQEKYDNAFKEFIRLGKETLFDEFFNILQANMTKTKGSVNYIINVDASTEDKFEFVIKDVVSEKEVDNYLYQSWRYNYVCKQEEATEEASKELEEVANPPVPPTNKQDATVHITWCVVCGANESAGLRDNLHECETCPASYHLPCRKDWLLTIIHRKNPPNKPTKETLVEKILSSTRTKCTLEEEKENDNLCPSCMWGPKVGYDDVVWHKLGSWSWWPARVLSPGNIPGCLLTRQHLTTQWPLRYYGCLNHSWGEAYRMCLFLPSHTKSLDLGEPNLKQAVLDACDDYIAVYLT